MLRYIVILIAVAVFLLSAPAPALAAPSQPCRELTVLTYNTHLFDGVDAKWLLWLKDAFGGQVFAEDTVRRQHIADRLRSSGADIVALQEVWADSWQQWFIDNLHDTYPHAKTWPSHCFCPTLLTDVLGNGLVLLSKWPLSEVAFQTFPTYDYSALPTGNDYWARKGVLTATADVQGMPIRIGISHALTGTAQDRSNWVPNYVANAITRFQLNGQPYIFALDQSNKAHIRRFEDYGYFDEATQTPRHGAGWTPIYEGPWTSDYRAVVSFELNGHPYLFSLKSGSDQAYITRINDDPATGWQTFGPYFWDKDYRPTAITTFLLNGHAYIFGLKSTWDQAWVYRVNVHPDTGEFNSSQPFEVFGPYPLSRYFGAIISFESNGRPWLYCLKSNYDQVYIQRINADPSTGKLNRTTPFTEFGPFTQQIDRHFIGETMTMFHLNARAYVFGVKSTWDQAWLYRINADPATGLQSLGWYPWSRDYVAVESFEMNGHPYLFALSGCCHDILHLDPCGHYRPGEAFIKRINDNGSAWENLYQLEDIRMIRDATVGQYDDVPAVMMGDFNIHADRRGIMDEIFRKAGAVDAWPQVHGPDALGDTVNWYDNRLMQFFYPDTQTNRVSRIDYVYVKPSGAALSLIPTHAYVIRDWTYRADNMDLSDHYPVATTFRLFPPECTAAREGDLDCDCAVDLADFAVLGSAWMSQPNDPAWCPSCDISNPADNRIDWADIQALAECWLATP